MDLLFIATRISSRCPKCGEIALLDENNSPVCDSCGWRPEEFKEVETKKESYLVSIITRSLESFGLSFVPNVVIDIIGEMGVTKEEAKNLLLKASRDGEIELRPESGLGRLSREEIELCIKTPNAVLSWIRINR